MNIALIIFCGKKLGGMERRFATLAVHLINEGYNVTLICTSDFKDSIRERGFIIPDSNIETIDMSSRSSVLFNKTNRLIGIINALIKSKKYSHIHLAMNPGILTYLYSMFSKILPDYSFSMVNSTESYNKKILVFSSKNAKKIDCLSDTIAYYAINSMEVTPQKVAVSPCSFIDYSRVKKSTVRDIDVIFLGRFIEHKGLDLLEEVDEMLKDINIHICGFGNRKPMVHNAEIYAVKDGFDVLPRAKIFLSIQKYENYPSQALIEAMASGCAIIATDVGNTRKILDPECCIFIDNDPEQLISAINYLLDNPKKCESMGLNAQHKVAINHNIERFSKYFLSEIVDFKN